MDFFTVGTKETRLGLDVFPDFLVGRHKDVMVRGQSFYAIWDEEAGLWSTDEYDVPRLVDKEVAEAAEKMRADGLVCNVKSLRSYSTNLQNQWRKFLKNVSDNSHQLDAKVVFANTEVKKTDYATRRLPYALEAGPHPAYDELIGTLYAEEEKTKLEWAIGAIIAGASKDIQKFIALYGPPGSGKGTILDVIKKLFPGYYTTFEAKALVGGNNNFATEAFKDNPLIAIDPDSKMDKIEDNTKFNMITGHDELRLNEKYKPTYTTRINTFVFIGTNDPIRITDAKSGLIRRIIDVQPSGTRLDPDLYYRLMAQIDFELGAIAQHCLDVYKSMGKSYYNSYLPLSMMRKTDPFYNFVEYNFDLFKSQDGTSLKQAYALYKEYADEAELKFKAPMYKFREELKEYFAEFHDRITIDGVSMLKYYRGFTAKQFRTEVAPAGKNKPATYALVLEETVSLLDEVLRDLPAQYASVSGMPKQKWENTASTLADIDTSKLHYVKVPENHIVIDFDLKGDDGEKSLEANLVAASQWPATYAELSKSGAGVHLHYLYTGGDAGTLAAEYADGIEIKVYAGNSSLRRKLSHCNNVPVATISSGLPFKEKKTVIETKTLQSEKGLRELIGRNLRKEIHPGTKASMDFIKKILDDAYESGMAYDVSDLKPKLIVFAQNSTNQSLVCLKTIKQLKLKSEAEVEASTNVLPREDRIVFFDVEVYPNLFIICWKYAGSDTVVRMINPSATEVEELFKFKLVGFNNRRYDNHILWAAMMGFTNEELYAVSQAIINNQGGTFVQAYNLSYADIYDFSSKKQGLKKFMIELNLPHVEMDLPWDQPVDKSQWIRVTDYCVNDVEGTEKVFEDRAQDFVARQILASLSGLSVNDTTAKHTAKIIFGDDREPQDKFIYTDLSEEFPGYTFDPFAAEKSTYRGEAVGEGGYVYAEPGMYNNVAVLDVASMHPTSMKVLELFGPYTQNFVRLMDARLAIKHKDYALAKALIGVDVDEDGAKELSYALKIVINTVYGLTAASFKNPFRDMRNKDNIVAKRGALFMVDLKNFVQERGFQVVHIKTDSIKIPDATPEIIDEVMQFGKKYGYDFEHENTYERFCLVNDAVYIARDQEDGHWEAVGAQFQHPVVFKALFTGEPITFRDLCETKQVTQGAMYLDFNEDSGTPAEPFANMVFVGKTGSFLPVRKSAGGAKLVRVKDDKSYAVGGTKGFLWKESEMVRQEHMDAVDRFLFEDLTQALEGTSALSDILDMEYYTNMAHDALETIERFGNYGTFIA